MDNLEKNVRHSIPIVWKTWCCKRTCSIFKNLVVCSLISLLVHYWYCGSDLLRYQQQLGWKPLNQKKTCCTLSKAPYDPISSLASFMVFEVFLFNCSSLNGVNFDSICVLCFDFYSEVLAKLQPFSRFCILSLLVHKKRFQVRETKKVRTKVFVQYCCIYVPAL